MLNLNKKTGCYLKAATLFLFYIFEVHIPGTALTVNGKGKQQTWVNLLEIKQCSYAIFIFFLKFSHAVQNNLGVIRSEHTA